MNKIIKSKIIYSIALLSIVFTVNAQQPKPLETLKKVEAYYKALKTLHLDVEYAMYKGHTGTQLTEAYNGNIYKHDDVTKLKILNSEILQFPEAQLIINKENKTINYNASSQETKQQSPLDMSAFLNFYKEVSTNISGNTIIHEMSLKSKQLPIPYGKVIIHVNKNDYSLEKQVLYLSTKVPFVGKDGISTEDVGRMVISFRVNSAYAKTPKLQDYVILESNKKPRLAKTFASYTIVNQSNI